MKTKYTSHTAAKPSWKNAILLGITALALPISAAFGATAIWTDGTGSWFTCTNWINNACPDSTTEARINNGGTAQIYLQTPSANASALYLGHDPGESGTVSVGSNNYGTLAVGDTIFVGYEGTGKLTITSGGTVTSAGASIASLTGQLWTSNGSASVDGTGSSWTVSSEFDVGGYNGNPGGTGLLAVTNRGTVTASGTAPAGKVQVYGSGTLTGNGTVSTTNGTTINGTLKPSGRLTIGSGNLSITLGGTLVCSVTQQATDNVYVTSGTATIDTNNSKVIVTITGSITAGDYPILYAPSGLFGKFRYVSIIYSGCLSPSIRYNYVNGYVYLHVDVTC